MAIGKRVIVVNIYPDVNDLTNVIVLDDSLDIDVKIHKDVMAYQNKAIIEVSGLTTLLRESLLSRFTAYQLSRLSQGYNSQQIFWRVVIEAGYQSNAVGQNQQLSTVFIGELSLIEPTSPPPTIGVKITCYTNQVDKTQWVTTNSLPGSATFEEVIQWAGSQLQLANPTNNITVNIDTDFANTIVTNAGMSFRELGAVPATLMQYFWPKVFAYIDDDTLYVRDRTKVDSSPPIVLSSFIGTPMWTDTGVKVQTLFNESLRLMSNVTVQSLMNPILSNSGFTVGTLDLHLTSRKKPFYTSFDGYITDQSSNQ